MPHYSRDFRAWLGEKIPDLSIGKGGTTNFPSRSPCLTPLDFFMWKYVNDKVYSTRVRYLTQLKRLITSIVCNAHSDIHQNV